MKYKTVKLGEYLYIKGRIGWKGLKKNEYLPHSDYRIINGESLTDDGIDWSKAGYITKERYDESPEIMLQEGDILVSKDGTIGKIGYITSLDAPTTVASGIFVIRNLNPELIDTRFIYNFLCSKRFKDFITMRTEGSVIPHLYQKDFVELDFPLPPIDEQKQIVSILDAISSKIDLNKAINNNLMQQAKTIFEAEIVNCTELPNGWKKSNLASIADYLNGLAMQNFRPNDDDQGLPVLKIKELRQGSCDADSERCSSYIKSNYIVNDGDVIFSWSGSLLVDFWCGGICGLNQHLFKVTSTQYAPWFFYSWTNYHLAKFAAIASAKATTMGHIKRSDIEAAEVIIPSPADYERIGALIQPLYDLCVALRLENRKLAATRDSLLPRLLSGDIDISEAII